PSLDGKTISLTTPVNRSFLLDLVGPTMAGPSAFFIWANASLVIDGETGLTQGITIERSGATGTPHFRLFDVAAGASLTLKGLTLSGGSAQGFTGGLGPNGGGSGGGSAGMGGAIFNTGSLTILNSTLTANTAQGGDGKALEPSSSFSPSGGGGGGLG